jgi:hypothetical protein
MNVCSAHRRPGRAVPAETLESAIVKAKWSFDRAKSRQKKHSTRLRVRVSWARKRGDLNGSRAEGTKTRRTTTTKEFSSINRSHAVENKDIMVLFLTYVSEAGAGHVEPMP